MNNTDIKVVVFNPITGMYCEVKLDEAIKWIKSAEETKKFLIEQGLYQEEKDE